VCVIDKVIMVLALDMVSWCMREERECMMKLLLTDVHTVDSGRISKRLMTITFITLTTVAKVEVVED